MKHSVPYRDLKLQRLQDPEYAKLYLETSLEDARQDGNHEAFLLALRDVVEAQGGVPEIAQQMNMPKQSLYHTVSKEGNPRLETLNRILKTLGLRLSIETIQ